MGEVIPFPRRTGEPWLRQAEAAAYLGVSVRTLRKWHAHGVPSHRMGAGPRSTPLYRASELDEWVRVNGRLRGSQG